MFFLCRIASREYIGCRNCADNKFNLLDVHTFYTPLVLQQVHCTDSRKFRSFAENEILRQLRPTVLTSHAIVKVSPRGQVSGLQRPSMRRFNRQAYWALIKALVNEDILSRTHCSQWCFLGCANLETFVADTKCFWTKSETFFCVRNKCYARGQTGKHLCRQQFVLACQGLNVTVIRLPITVPEMNNNLNEFKKLQFWGLAL